MTQDNRRISLAKALLFCGLASMIGFLGGVAVFWSSNKNTRNKEHHRSLVIPHRPSVPVWDHHGHSSSSSFWKGVSLSSSVHHSNKEQQPLAYTEFLVHPALLVHPNPQHVAIWTNDWDSAQTILDQVQKHPTVTQVSILLVDSSDKDLEDTCTTTSTTTTTPTVAVEAEDHGSLPRTPHPSPNTLHPHPRVQVYSSLADMKNKQEELQTELAHTVDVLLLDTSVTTGTTVGGDTGMEEDQSSYVPLWEQLLRLDQGILVASLPTTLTTAVQRVAWMDRVLVQRSMFEQVTDYILPTASSSALLDRAHRHWFAVAFVHRTTFANWHLNEADFAYRLRERHISTTGTTMDSEDSLVAYFDSAIMASLRFPSRVSENAFCQYAPDQCGGSGGAPVGIDLYATNIPRSQLQVKRSGVGDYAGRGVFSTVDIPANSYLDLESTAHPVRVPWKASKIVWDLVEENDYFEERGVGLHYYFEGYGFSDEPWGLQEEVVDSSLLAFINHGCNSTYNIGSLMRQNEFEVDVDNPPEEVTAMYYSSKQASYNPRKDRNKMTEQSACLTCKPIRVGDEILDNYLTFGGITHFKTQTLELREQCMGASGEIERFQETKSTGASLNQRATTTTTSSSSSIGSSVPPALEAATVTAATVV